MSERRGGYVLGEPIASGGMGVVYRATELGTQRLVAVKTVRVVNRAHLAALRAETRTLSRLRHPGLAGLLAHGVTDGIPWYAMPLLSGPTLRDYLSELWGRADDDDAASDPTSPRQDAGAAAPLRARPERGPSVLREAGAGRLEEVLSLARRLCLPLRYLHRRGIVHGDIKPRNIILSSDGAPILIDFGMVSHFSSEEARLELGARISGGGTAPYIAPELSTGGMPDASTDIFSLGVVLYQAVCNVLPFDARLASGDGLGPDGPPRPSLLVRGVDPRLDELIGAMMAARPESRIRDVEDVETALTALLSKAVSASVATPAPRVRRPPLMGRQAELDRLLSFVEQARAGKGACVVVAGESGIGKTRLLTEFVHRLQRMGVGVAIGRSDAAPVMVARQGGHVTQPSGGKPLAVLSEFFIDLADRLVESRHSSEPSDLPMGELTLLSAFSHELGLALGGSSEQPPAFPADLVQPHLFAAIQTLLASVCRDAPFVLVIDDVQWADALSLSLLRDLAERFLAAHPVLIVCAYRVDRARAEVDALIASRLGELLPLNAFAPELTRRFIDASFGAGDGADAELLAYLDRRAGGNPLMLWECLRVGVAEGRFARSGSRWRLARPLHLDAEALMPAVERVFGESFGSLAADELEVAQAASVIGAEFSETDVAILVGQERGRLRLALRGLCLGAIVEETASTRYRFRHDGIREFAYFRLEVAERRRLHGRFAEGLLAQTDTQLATWGDAATSISLAQHFEASGDVVRSARYWLAAGEKALESWAFQDAVTSLEKGLAFARQCGWGSDADRARWHRQLGDAQWGLGNVRDSRASLQAAAALLGFRVPSAAQIAWRLPMELLQLKVEALQRRLRPDVLPSSRPCATATEATRVFDRLLQVYYHAGEDRFMLFSTVRGLRLAERSDEIPERTTAYSNAAAVAGLIPLRPVARWLWSKADRSASSRRDGIAESYVAMQLGIYLLGLGELSDASEQLKRAIAGARAVGFSRRVEECTVILAMVPLAAGHFTAAHALYDDVLQSALKRGDRQTRCWALLGRALVNLRLGVGSPSMGEIEEAALLALKLGRGDRLWAHGLRALAHLHADHLDEAREAADAAEAEAEKGPPLIPSWLEPYSHVAEVRLAEFRRSPGKIERAALMAACRRLRSFAKVFPLGEARARRLDALRSRALGDERRAGEGLRASAELASRRGLDFDFALAGLALCPFTLGANHENDVRLALERCGVARDTVGAARGVSPSRTLRSRTSLGP